MLFSYKATNVYFLLIYSFEFIPRAQVKTRQRMQVKKTRKDHSQEALTNKSHMQGSRGSVRFFYRFYRLILSNAFVLSTR